MEFIFERTVNYYETDKMGITHHSNYIRFLEEARCEFLKEINLPYEILEEKKIMIPVLGVNCTYKHPSTFGDILVIKAKIKKFTGVQMVVSYEITNKKTGDLVLIGETKHCFTSTELKPISILHISKYDRKGKFINRKFIRFINFIYFNKKY